jgi:hypothetical protein
VTAATVYTPLPWTCWHGMTKETPMANDNCLAGMRCPSCGAEEPFRVGVTPTLVMWDDGSDPEAQLGDLDWEEWSYCKCITCDYEGQVQDFRHGHPVPSLTALMAFVTQVAQLDQAGEPAGVSCEGEEARDALHALIDQARAVLGTARPTPEGDPHGQ